MRLLTHLATRLGIAALTLLGVSLLVFAGLRLLPGGFEQMVLGADASPQARAELARKYGLDESGPRQYVKWLGAAARGDFGVSMATGDPVAGEMARRAPATIQLSLIATASAALVGLPLGLLAGLGAGPWRAVGRVVGALGASVPEVVLGTVVVYVFSRWRLGATVGGYVPFSENPLANLAATVLPGASLGIFGVALLVRTTRDAVQRVLTEGHILTAIAQGQTRWHIVRHHVLRNAGIPVLTVGATYVGYLLGGALVVEILFSVPGIGLYVYNALANRDYAVVQAGVLVAAAVFIAVNTLADLGYALLDPRIGGRRPA
jgi:peptide/nickel transport system permease protein